MSYSRMVSAPPQDEPPQYGSNGGHIHGAPALDASTLTLLKDLPARTSQDRTRKQHEAEQGIIGAALQNAGAATLAQDEVAAYWLCSAANRKTFACICDLFKQGKRINVANVSRELEARGELADVGGESYLRACVSHSDVNSVAAYAKHISDQHDARETAKHEAEMSALDAANTPAPAFDTDTANAERFARQHGANVRYCYASSRWFIFNGARWAHDLDGQADRLAKETARSIYAEAANEPSDTRRGEIVKHAKRSESRASRAALLELARSEAGIAVRPDQWDADPHAFNVANGTLNLKTGKLHPHDRAALLTHLAPVAYDPAATCPTWRASLERWLPDAAQRAFVQDAGGAALSGVALDEFWLFLYGDGANGKSTFVRVLEWLCGDYGHKAQAETFMDTPRDRDRGKPAPELLALKGKRLVTVQETAQRHRLNEALIKDLTGRDSITARGTYERHEVTFTPQFTLWMFGNHKPQIRDTSAGTWRRVRLIEFGQSIPESERDPHLADRLRAELPGILNWALEGLQRVQGRGLVVPDAVRAATESYRTEQDTFAAFLADCCATRPTCEATAAQLWEAWCAWCKESNEREGTQRAFGNELTRRGFQRGNSNGVRKWSGVGILNRSP